MSRRTLLIGSCATVATAGWPPTGARAELADERMAAYEAALGRILNGRTPEVADLVMELPELAENGNTVLFRLALDSPMTAADYVIAFHLLATANQQPVVAVFRFTPASGRAAVTGRMRLAKTQNVVSVAETSTGRMLIATQNVEVTIGGCQE